MTDKEHNSNLLPWLKLQKDAFERKMKTGRGGILTFEVKRPNALGIAVELSEKSNVMIRDGVFCVHPYFNKRREQNARSNYSVLGQVLVGITQ